MTTIAEGMTPAQFITAMNDNFTDVIVGSTALVDTMDGYALQTALNNNFSQSDTYVGQKGFINKLNGYFSEYDISLDAPSGFGGEWIDDFLRITLNESVGNQCEIWEQLNSGTYVLIHTLNSGIETVDYKTWQNADLNFRIRAKNGSHYSIFSDVANVKTPWVFYTDQTESFRQIMFYQIRTNGELINVDWDDGDDEDYSSVGNVYEEVFHDYDTPGAYFIKLTGETRLISILQFFNQPIEGTDITKWVLPDSNFWCHLYGNGLIGCITDWVWPITLGGIHLATNPLITGNVDSLFSVERPNWWDCHLPIGGNATNWILSPKMAHILIGTGMYGDLSGWRFPKNNDYTSWMLILKGTLTGDISNLFDGEYQYLHTIELLDLGLNGDLSGWFIGVDYPVAGSIELNGNNFTKLPRGNFHKFGIYDCHNNNCNSDEIDAILADVETNVTANAPEYDCVYTLNGTGMGIPSAAGLTSRQNIIDKYVAEGKTCTITVNN